MNDTHPLVVRLGGAEYVRSIQKANPDGSLSFYCAIDEGLVLTLAEGHDLLTRMEGLFSDLRQRIGPPQLVIGFECVLNRLEAERSASTVPIALVTRWCSSVRARVAVTNSAGSG